MQRKMKTATLLGDKSKWRRELDDIWIAILSLLQGTLCWQAYAGKR